MQYAKHSVVRLLSLVTAACLTSAGGSMLPLCLIACLHPPMHCMPQIDKYLYSTDNYVVAGGL